MLQMLEERDPGFATSLQRCLRPPARGIFSSLQAGLGGSLRIFGGHTACMILRDR